MAAAAKLHRHVGRRRAARFLAEGPNLVEAALRRGLVSELFATEAAADRFADLLAGVPVELVTERAAKALSDTVTPVGLVAVCAMPDSDLDAVLAGGPTLVAVPVEISEPGNAGTLIRVADAMGADAVVLAGPSVDPYNGKCLRASAGSIFSVPVVSEPDAVRAVTRLKDAGVQILATVLDGDVSLDDAELSVPTAWLFGPEAHGLPADVAALASARVHIPMTGQAESLNVASAAAICLYASARARRAAQETADR
ncbi:RNA methyltransferase [Mycolicibacterium chubuense]|uniref:23S rRNA (Uridine(2479)-2'-O)-methyltransferase n=1 Tax=Mycolicibacterium chubuense TaxID=1800 RepID=A0A0J6VBB6_MYCCU|nr:RNA methyltransferase [Mycolicibacterium chubuense]KMO67002.1 23S rRNA (uridine(2479)-2'-O)-methyltransferase [Mycolicibacterium chubuense]ORA55482.1 RNA methyltransferase [Mycolicibacterium chubuense]SPX95875.1 rRNA methylase [Mycolicibacterium chubuense]